MPAYLGPILPILAAAALLQLGNGLLATLIGVRLEGAGFAASVTGLVTAAYFAGQLTGSSLSGGVINRVGHIRAFASFATVLSAAALIYALAGGPFVWSAVRFANGFAMAGVLLAMESWLNHVSGNARRGSALSTYMAVCYAALSVGPLLMMIEEPEGFALFSIASILMGLSLLPMSLSNRAQPGVAQPSRLRFRDLLRISPLGIAGAVLAGAMIAPLVGLSSVYAVSAGHGVSGAAAFWLALIGGGFALSFPIGRLSDRIERRLVLAGICFAALAAALVFRVVRDGSLEVLMVFGAVFGGLVFAAYPLAAAHTNDHLPPEDSVPAAAGLLIAFGTGAVAGPPVAALAMDLAGPAALFDSVAAIAAGLGLFALYRRTRRADVDEAEKGAYIVLPRTSPAAYEMDPWSGDAPAGEPLVGEDESH
ncbi:MAG: MFS transporter [Alphaproteobacteria bacterium]|nr:MFS transporter [Alphaproteobacteria bacterium]